MTEDQPVNGNQIFSTPMMKQYQEIKEQHSDCLLFFRLGDFYELFNEDAKIGAQVLNITLTKRPRGKDGDIPMAGVPFHAADVYIAKLVRAGYKIAICEQVTEPNSRGIVEREVIRIVTPGTILDEKTLEKKEHNYVMSLAMDSRHLGIAVADISTGDFQAAQLAYSSNLPQLLGSELIRFSPAECIMNGTLYADAQLLKVLAGQKGMNISHYADWDRFAEDAGAHILSHFRITTLQSLGLSDKPLAVRASAGLLGYLKHTQKDNIQHVQTIRTYSPQQFMALDRSTIANLELFSTIREHEHRGSFIQVLDHTSTAMGGRMLRQWIREPLCKKEAIEARLAGVQALLDDYLLREQLERLLSQMADIPRLLGRLSVGIGNAYDLINLKRSLVHTLALRTLLETDGNVHAHECQPYERRDGMTQSTDVTGFNKTLLFNIDATTIDSLRQLISLINITIMDNPPIDTKGGGLIKPGIHEQLDELRGIVSGGKEWIVKLENQERKRTGINSLKVKFNKVFGYYIEISKANLSSVPEDYLRKQTMVNAERFITPELKEYEEKILTAEDTIGKLEYQLFMETVHQVLSFTPTLQQLSRRIAGLDCLVNFAAIAEQNEYVRPAITEDGALRILEGRHPVVERLCASPFVPNDTLLDQDGHQLIVITGPNMAGKSVFMRQVALLVLMAHIGCFVPAREASISLTDRIFVRSGASDFIASGLSTFMVEMVETAHILNHATPRSLVIMDEIGRGTSTYDGISIAWAVAEYLVTNPRLRSKTLFATHYHELQKLEERYPDRIRNYNVAVQQKEDGDPIFLHKVLPGGASHSYAIAVAKLAGVPKEVTSQAAKLLKKLEGGSLPKSNTHDHTTLLQQIADLNLSAITPLEALNTLDQLQKKLADIDQT